MAKGKVHDSANENTQQENRVESFAYLDLLENNAPKAFPEYDAEALILKKQIDDPSVCNVAVVAKFGAGKSSVINTYLYNHRRTEKERKDDSNLGAPENNKYTRITLSTFNNAEYDESAIERSILQQLLYSRKKSELPNSEIKRTNKTSFSKSFWTGLLVALFIIAAVLFGIETSGILLFIVDWTKYLFLSIAASALCMITIGFIHFRKLSRIKYKDFEADIQNEDNKEKPKQVSSLINKFVDEVLYFFECVNIDLVIFEDLDRLPTTEIFAKLRELNTIINGSRMGRERVTFLYAVKDELFKTEEERAKFFEFILPVVPVVNPVTTEEALRIKLKELTDINTRMTLNNKFIKGISTYISDMRVLKNTFNDYIVMFSKIFDDKNASEDLKPEKLFALCLYKNRFPYDYALLESDKGLIPKVINIKELRERAVKETQNQIEQSKKRIEVLQKESSNSFIELRYMFVGQLADMPSDWSGSNRSVQPGEIKTFEGLDFRNIIDPTRDGYTIQLDSTEDEILTPSGERYIDRENAIKEKRDKGIEKVKETIATLEKNRQTILGLRFAEFIKRYEVDFCFQSTLYDDYSRSINAALPADDELFLESLGSINKVDKAVIDEITEMYKKFKQAEFPEKLIKQQIEYLRFLVANDYIDEHYLEYTSNYKAQLISPKDLGLVMSIQRRVQDFECIPDDISGVIGRLEENDFKYPAVLNKNLLDNIEKIRQISRDEGSQKYDNLISVFSDVNSTIVFERLREYIETAEVEQCEELLKAVIPLRPTLCAEVLKADALTAEKKDFIFSCTIKYGNDFRAANAGNRLAAYISSHEKYLDLFDGIDNDNLVTKFISETGPSIKVLSKESLDGAVQSYIIANSKYALTLENLETILGIGNTESQTADFYTRNYDIVSSSDKPGVAANIASKINEYANAVLLNEKVTCINEPQDKVAALLKPDKIDVEIRKAIIRKSRVKFESIAEFDEELFGTLLDNNSVEPSWANILCAFEKKGFDCVKAFLLRNKTIHGHFIEGDKGVEIHDEFIEALVSDVSADEITSIANSMNTICDVSLLLSVEATDENVAAFIAAGRVRFINTDLANLYTRPKSLCAYLKKHGDSIMAEFDTFFNNALPQQTRQYAYNQIVYSPKANANIIIAAVLSCAGINQAIKETLIDECAPIIQIAGHERLYADYIIGNRIAVPAKILWQFANAPISTVEKLDILEYCSYGADELDSKKVKAYLSSLGEPYTLLFGAEKEARFDKNSKTERLLYVLKKMGLVSSWKKAPLRDEYKVKAT